ncbi:MAG: chromosome segregation protein SMC [Cyanobacteria bacterium]|nr:chromosome segregation protein SMC [Cyanobacteriota bacterium]MDW8199827.1 chromosome segregation protein SMC [Cyanobacteriota bacterium SKYGB_h_bin112]
MYVKRVELSNFKSFGGTTSVPLLPGFTVISGPNGSGKSNILDAVLFALGLSSSKGMRAERLPDLVNHAQMTKGRSVVETSVSVTFDIEHTDLDWQDEQTGDVNDQTSQHGSGSENRSRQSSSEHSNSVTTPATAATEWTVTRRLRVTQQGAYTSNYYFNGQPCTLAELHEQLRRLRIYPEGYNVVLQGDVTGIISMNPRERREIIDELAGVAAFDRKISQAKEKLDAVKEREDKFRIVEAELIAQRDRLAQDRIKAQKYQNLRQELEEKTQWEAVIHYRQTLANQQQLAAQIEADDRRHQDLTVQLASLATEIQQIGATLEQLNARVKAMGEEEQLSLQATLATREAELRQLQRQEQELTISSQQLDQQLHHTQQDLQTVLSQLEELAHQQQLETMRLEDLRTERDRARHRLDQSRGAASAIAAASEAWIQQQTQLRHQIDALLSTVEPQRAEQARLQERVTQLSQQLQEQQQMLASLTEEIAAKQQQTEAADQLNQAAQQQVQTLVQIVADLEQAVAMHQQTQSRLLQEQRDKQRKLDKLEAQAQAMQESQGTGATRLILQLGLPGVCGLVAQLGRVDPRYQLALEIAAGARLGHLVVEDDSVAAAGIELLKQRRAGRATFLPLNKLAPARSPGPTIDAPGFVDYAVNLIEYDRRYQDVFAHVFGSTAVFTTLEDARRCLGRYRMVTLDGELLETSGAITGGSSDSRYQLHFGTVDAGESAEISAIRQRLQEIEQVLERCDRDLTQAQAALKQHQQQLVEARQQQREAQIHLQQHQRDRANLDQQQHHLHSHWERSTQELAIAEQRLAVLATDLPQAEHQLDQWRRELNELEQSQNHSQWQQIQTTLRAQEAELQERELAVRSSEQRLSDLDNQQQRLQEKAQQLQLRIQDIRQQQTQGLNQQAALSQQLLTMTSEISQLQAALAQLEQTLATVKQERDRTERQWRERQATYQQLAWEQQKLQETLQTRRMDLVTINEQLQSQWEELPTPLPDIPDLDNTPDLVARLASLQHELRSLQKRIQAMEPVNMLALEEYERTQERLDDLSKKLTILDEERTELLLRIENFTTLRQQAFQEAFDAVNENFQAIFAELSDGDGRLQLDDPSDPFNSGLNLIAHPKGKPIQRLASMSGGEKSLTALSFIFALQRYRPSSFYAFDEVDMFLDGANVERLAKMIKKQAQHAQFIVVSLRRPMIESAERTIGVTQARGAYTQVLGIKLQSASV